MIGVGRGEDAGSWSKDGSPKALVVAGAVEPLVVSGGDGDQTRQCRRASEHSLGVVRVQTDALRLGMAERARPVPDAGRHTVAAEVVHQARPAHGDDIVGWKAGFLGGAGGDGGDATRVPGEKG